MGKNNQSEVKRQNADRKNRYSVRKLKKGVASVLVGASILGVGVSILPSLSSGDNNVTLEAAETGAQIIAFDHYVLEGQDHNLTDNVKAFEVIDGESVDLSAEVDVLATNILDKNTQEITYSVVGSDGVEKRKTVTITYGKDYASALTAVDNALVTLELELGVLGDEADGVQSQFADISTQLDELRADYDAYVALAGEQDADIAELNERAAGIETNIATITQAITYSLADVADLSAELDTNHAFITEEITRLEDELTAFRDSTAERVAALEAELPEKATQEEVDAVQVRVDAFLASSDGIEASLSGQLDTLNGLYENIVNGSIERDEAMLEMLNLQEDRLDTLRDTLAEVSTSSDERIAALEAELATKAEPAEIAALEEALATAQADAAVTEQSYVAQIEAAEAVNSLLSERINGYESIISELETQLAELETEMSVLERILEAIELGAEDVTIVDEDGNVEDIENPEEFVDDKEEEIEEEIEDILPDPETPVDEEEPVDDPSDDFLGEEPVNEPVDEEPVAEPVDKETPVDKSTDDFLNEEIAPVEPIAAEEDVIAEEDVLIGGEDLTVQPAVEPVDDGTDPFLGEDAVDDGTTTTDDGTTSNVDGGSVDGESPDTPVSSDDPAVPGASDGSGETPNGGNGTEATAVEDGAAPTAEGAAEGDLPQTGAGFGAIAGIGLTSLTAIGAGVTKFFRKRG